MPSQRSPVSESRASTTLATYWEIPERLASASGTCTCSQWSTKAWRLIPSRRWSSQVSLAPGERWPIGAVSSADLRCTYSVVE